MPFSILIPILLVATIFQMQQTDGIVELRMRRNIPSAILASNNPSFHGNDDEKLRWYGADAQQVLR